MSFQDNDTNPDLVIRGLPFESQEKDICDFFGVDESQVRVLKWNDSGRCKGTAFLYLNGNADDIDKCSQKHGCEFSVQENSREIRVSEYQEREKRSNNDRRPRQNTRRRNNRNRNNDNDEQLDYETTDESQREVYVSNIPFEAVRADFDDVFASCGEIEDVTIPRIYSSGRPKGFAFVRFASADAVEKALQLDRQIEMKERTLGVRPNKGRVQRPRRERKQRSEGLSERPENCTTIFVGNLPFSTTEDQLAQVFEPFGEIKSTRIVIKSWTKQSRGFGYVEFTDESCVDEAVKQTLVIDERELRIDYANNQ